MRAAVLHGKEDVRIEDVPLRALESGEVRVRVEAALTCGTDLKVFKRGYHAKMIVPPAVFGHEFAGVIEEVAPGGEDWRVGDRVVAANSAPCGDCFFCRAAQENLCEDLLFLNGAYAESVVVPARIARRNLLRLRSQTSFSDAALVEPLACVVQGVEDTGLKPGQRLLVIGAGPIGLMFVALARSLGCDVTVIGRGEHRLAIAAQLGANRVESSETDSVLPKGDRGFDAVIEAVGKPEVWELAVRLVRKGGVVNFFGGCPAGTAITIDTTLLHYSNLTLRASFHHTPRTIRRSLQFIEDGVIRSQDFVSGTCSLDQLPALFRRMADGNRAVKTLINVHR
ncbi:MAG: alcohol dehydrogenase catalytic domain-containing protein [Verrucomicrobia bacterium]|jgi:L-iditol 2-dehydrogenase|nr:alcohol dehydrogenase catalytic domain-containing protein [Verrucomicrobiota bacterium]